MWYPETFLLGRVTKQSAIALASLITGTTLPSLAVLTLASFLAKSSGRATLLHLLLPGSAIRTPPVFVRMAGRIWISVPSE